MTLPARTAKYNKPVRREDVVIDPVDEPRKVILSGDTHGDGGHVRWIVQHAKQTGADAVFVLGDFGIWDHLDNGRFTDTVSKDAQRHGVPVFFLPGNHDNYDLLFEWEATKPRTADGFFEIKPGLYYSPRGHRWTWHGTRFMSLGGAYSVDKQPRVLQDGIALRRAQAAEERGSQLAAKDRYMLRLGQWQWWGQEEISQEELDHALRDGEVDILLTHDKPRLSSPGWNRKDLEECWTNQEAIQDVVDEKKPKLLVHGHLHWPYDQRLPSGTVVKGLDCDPDASRHSGGTGMKMASIAVLELGKTWDDGKENFTLVWEGKTFEGWSNEIRRDFELRQDATAELEVSE